MDAEEGVKSEVQRLAQDIVVEGVVIFYPDASARKKFLLSMISSVFLESQPRSWWLQFGALCHHFSKSDAKSLLGLPLKPTQVHMYIRMQCMYRYMYMHVHVVSIEVVVCF